MTMSLALNNALSGLSVASRGVEVVSNNVANALTEGFSARELVVSSRTVGGAGAGVGIDGVERRIDLPLLYDRRSAEASRSGAETTAEGLSQIEDAIGDPTEEGSLSQRVAEFEANLISAASRPDSTPRLDLVMESANALAQTLREASAEVQSVRQDADRAIAADVDTLNETLQDIADLDQRIFRLGNGNRDVTGLLDQRQAMVDQVNEIIPVRELPRDGGKIALYSTSGTMLYDGRAAEIEFTQTTPMTADRTYAGGDLSGLTVNGVAVNIDEGTTRVGGGRLQANFQLRDVDAPEAQTELDAFARDLIERFQDPSVDATRLVGDAGLFTDDGAVFDPLNEVGVADRIALSSLVNPAEGGELWRLRDGLGATVQGSVGDASLLQALGTQLSAPRTVASGDQAGLDLSVSEMAAEVSSRASGQSQSAQQTVAFETTRYDTLREAELGNGVDTDDEMRRLLLLEQAYAANARVISTIDDLLDTLIRI